jgi:hypothetical protein
VVIHNARDTIGADWHVKKAAYDTAKTAFDPVYAAYRALPEEADAWRTGNYVQHEYRKRHPPIP